MQTTRIRSLYTPVPRMMLEKVLCFYLQLAATIRTAAAAIGKTHFLSIVIPLFCECGNYTPLNL